jgi:4-amino-4-deoxy-L-arabinose transferase-like glycosyltransferase
LLKTAGRPSYPIKIGLFLLALAVRIVAIEATGAASIRFGDGPDYINTARSICTDQVYPERGNLPFFRPPGLPFFIAAATLCEPSRTRAIKYALAAVDAGTVVVIFELALLLFGTAPAMLAALGAALYPFFIFSTTDVRSEPLFMFLLTLAMLLLLRGKPAGAGVATALAALTRPTALLCLPLFALFAGRKKAAPLLIAGVLTLAPWMARNYLRFGELIPVNDAGSYSVWHASHEDTRRIYATRDRAEFKRREWEFETKTIHEVARQVESRATTPNARDAEWRRLALEELTRDPEASARFALQKAWYYWRPWLNPIEYSTRTVVASAAILIPLFVLAAIGIARHRLRWAVLLFFAVLWLAHIPHQVVMRYRIPFTDPLLLVFAAYTICGWGYPKSMRSDETSANPMRLSLSEKTSRDS